MSAEFTIPADHPALPGHFPGRPLVPAVLMLDAALRAVGADRPGVRVITARFTAPLEPAQTLTLEWDPAPSDVVTIRGRIGAVPALRVRIRPPPDGSG
ncbi:MAG: hypothetical protein ACP5NP_08200 [Acetobacteraceae bacterium]